MALTFFWRCEGTTLDATHDENANNATETAGTSGTAPSISGTGAKVGSNGVVVTATGQFNFNVDTDIVTAGEGAMAGWFYTTNWPGSAPFFKIRGNTFSNNVSIATDDGDDVKLMINEDGTPQNLSSGISTLATGNWYFIGVAWDDAANSRRIVVLDTDGDPLADVEDTTTNFTAPGELARDPGIQIGDVSGLGWQGYIDNLFIGNEYEDLDHFVTNRNITSASSYSTGGGADPEGRLIGGKLIRGGLLIGGVLR